MFENSNLLAKDNFRYTYEKLLLEESRNSRRYFKKTR